LLRKLVEELMPTKNAKTPRKQERREAHVQNPETPRQADNEPLGDRGGGDRTWTPPDGEQGISNRPDDEA
jgi:hypothetical protein